MSWSRISFASGIGMLTKGIIIETTLPDSVSSASSSRMSGMPSWRTLSRGRARTNFSP